MYKDVDTPNGGREASSYLWWLAEQEYAPEDRIAFVQGNPFEHSPRLWRHLLTDTEGFYPLNRPIRCGWSGAPHHQGLPLGEWWDEWIGTERPQPGLEFTPGAQFVITGEQALQRTREWYGALYGAVMASHTSPWVLERLWAYIWH